MQTDRYTSLPLTLVVLVALLEGAKLKYVATPQPDVTDLQEGEPHTAALFDCGT